MSEKANCSLRLSVFSILLWCLFLSPGTVFAAVEWGKTNIYLYRGATYETGQGAHNTLRFEHFDGWAYGDNFFFLDAMDFDGQKTELYGEFHPRLSFGKMTGRTIECGPLSDILLAGELNYGAGPPFRAFLGGLGFDFKIPKFTVLGLNVYYRRDPSVPGFTYQVSPFWDLPFSIGKYDFDFAGFLDYAGAQNSIRPNLLTIPQLFLDIGKFWNCPGKLYIGTRYAYWHNKFGIEGLNESVWEPGFMWTVAMA